MKSIKQMVAIAIVAIPLCATAQKKDTTIVVGNRTVVISGIDSIPTVRIYNGDLTEMNKVSESHFVDGREVEKVFVTSPFIPTVLSKRKRILRNHYPTVFFGYNLLNGNAMGLGGNSGMPTRNGKSWEWGVTITSILIRINNSLALTSSLAIGQVFNHFKANNVLATENGNTFITQRPADESVKKSYIRYDFVRIPVMIEWQTRLARRDAFVAVGPAVELRSHERSRYVVGGDKHTQTSDINLKPVGLSLDMRAGYGMIMLYARTGLTPLLSKSKAPDCYPCSIGIGFRL